MNVFLGIGNLLRQDDGLGIHVVRDLKEELGGRKDCVFFECGVAPVSLLGKIPKEPEVLFILDALRAKDTNPGECILIEVEEFKDKKPISTHRLPLRVIDDCLNPSKTYLGGAVPVEMGFGTDLSSEAQEAEDKLVNRIVDFVD